MILIDTHIHLYEESYNPDRALIIETALQQNICGFVLPNIDVESISPLKQLIEQYPSNCFGLMGLHPCYVKDNIKEQLALIKQELFTNNYYGVGEIGIDLYWDKSTFELQKEAFIIQCQWALELNLPIAVHCRESIEETIHLVKQINKENNQYLRGVFHCFTGNLDQAKQLIDLGFYLGIGGVVTFKNGKIDQILQQIPLTAVVLETDGPYLAPVPHRGKRNEPQYLKIIAQRLAAIYNVPLNTVAEITSKNAKQLFNLPE
jgi:TatD DNase family protein